MTDNRIVLLQRFSRQALDSANLSFAPASADASFRRYFRATHNQQSWIVMDAPPDKENLDQFIRIAKRLRSLGLNVPDVLAYDIDNGFCLLTDLGSIPYLDALNAQTVERLYGDALSALVTLQRGTLTEPTFLPPYSFALLRQEMELFRQWYVTTHLRYPLSAEEDTMLTTTFDRLATNALAQPQVWVHRDYHSRNLMVESRHNPGILDFQDAVQGAITYDLVSLLKDCYISWPRTLVVEWVKGYCRLSYESGLHRCEDEDQFVEWFDHMGVQRHLKVAGIFARLHYRDGKSTYLNDLPLTLHYLQNATAQYDDLAPLHALLDRLGTHL